MCYKINGVKYVEMEGVQYRTIYVHTQKMNDRVIPLICCGCKTSSKIILTVWHILVTYFICYKNGK